MLVFAAVAPGDTEKEMDTLASKVLRMKLWDDEAGGRVRLLPSLPSLQVLVACRLTLKDVLSGRRT